jgi:sortase A
MSTVAHEAGEEVVVDVTDTPDDVQPRPANTQPTLESARKSISKMSVAIGITLGVSALAVWFLLYASVLTAFEEHGSQTRLYEKYRVQLAEETAPLGAPIAVGSPVAMIDAKEIGIHNLVVVEGSTARQLLQGPGHLSDTALPGQYGDSVILGRSVTYGAPFRAITQLRPGDRLTVTTGQGVFIYRVQDVRYPGAPAPPTLYSNQSRLTLVTSASDGWRSGWAPTETVYVDAILQHGQAQPVPAGVPKRARAASLPMQGNSHALLPLTFWFEGLVVAAALIAWSWIRWGRWQTWVVGLPSLLFILWGTSNALVQFLPNLL